MSDFVVYVNIHVWEKVSKRTKLPLTRVTLNSLSNENPKPDYRRDIKNSCRHIDMYFRVQKIYP